MRRASTIIALAFCTLLCVSISSAQQTSATATTASTSVPNLIRYSGTLKDAQGAALVSTTPVGVTFAIYQQQDGGAAVWQETQNVTPETNGQYSVILGSTTAIGLPDDLFSQPEQRWLGVQVQGEAEQARVLLVSVPYAFKAHEADTLGGLPSSAFVQAATPGITSATLANGTAVNALSTAGNARSSSPSKGTTSSSKPPCSAFTGSGTQFYIAYWDMASGCSLSSSVIYQSPLAATVNYIGIANPTPKAQLDVGGAINAYVYQIDNVNALAYYPGDNLVIGGSGFLPCADNMYPGPGGSSNIFIGLEAGCLDAASLFAGGIGNTFLGVAAGYSNGTGATELQGNFNTFLGDGTGRSNTIGSNNTYIGAAEGYGAGSNNVTGSNNIYIANVGIDSESNTVRIGAPRLGPGNTYIVGIYSTHLPIGNEVVCIDSNGQLGTRQPDGSPCGKSGDLQSQQLIAAQQDAIRTQQQQLQTQRQQIEDLQERLSRLESLIAKK